MKVSDLKKLLASQFELEEQMANLICELLRELYKDDPLEYPRAFCNRFTELYETFYTHGWIGDLQSYNRLYAEREELAVDRSHKEKQ